MEELAQRDCDTGHIIHKSWLVASQSSRQRCHTMKPSARDTEKPHGSGVCVDVCVDVCVVVCWCVCVLGCVSVCGVLVYGCVCWCWCVCVLVCVCWCVCVCVGVCVFLSVCFFVCWCSCVGVWFSGGRRMRIFPTMRCLALPCCRKPAFSRVGEQQFHQKHPSLCAGGSK